jgi:hypothetical protein
MPKVPFSKTFGPTISAPTPVGRAEIAFSHPGKLQGNRYSSLREKAIPALHRRARLCHAAAQPTRPGRQCPRTPPVASSSSLVSTNSKVYMHVQKQYKAQCQRVSAYVPYKIRHKVLELLGSPSTSTFYPRCLFVTAPAVVFLRCLLKKAIYIYICTNAHVLW